MNPTTSPYWRRKINALLHDTPDKATDIRDHENRAAQIKAIFQFDPTESFDKAADWNASAADRLPFPPPAKITQPLLEIQDLPHPLGGASLPNIPFKTSTEALEITQKSHPFLLDSDDPRAAFICIWRFWRNWATSLDPRFTRLPADTRIPDHTIWNHLNVTTAFQGSLATKEQKIAHPGTDLQPRLLLFSIGPVQDFIAAARSTRDLWSGSYLLSYLVSHALGKISHEIGPEHLIFPNLLDQPLIDLQLKDSLFSQLSFSGKPIWDSLGYSSANLSKLLTPSLPNRFMALLPACHPESGVSIDSYSEELAESVRQELRKIAGSIRDFLEDHRDASVCTFRPDVFDAQVDRMLEIQWQTLPIPKTLDELYQTADSLLPEDDKRKEDKPKGDKEDHYTPRAAIDAILAMVKIPACKPQYEPLKPETGWCLLNALIAFLHDGVKSTRHFDAWREGRWQSGKDFNKDALNGKEEAVLSVVGNEAAVKSYFARIPDLSQGTFKPGELLGASSLIKRLWHHTFLPEKIGISPQQLRAGHPMPNTHAIAKAQPFDDSDESDAAAERDHGDKYFAILALDGDEMGKWVSGSKTPRNGELLSPKAKAFYQQHAPDFVAAPRAVTPSWHLQFAEALGNFSFHAVQRIVESFDGRLLYAGGDDVLAMLPAKDALRCARALRAAFRGEETALNALKGKLTGVGKRRKSDRISPLFNLERDGFLQLHQKSGSTDGLISDPVKFPAIVPGPRTDVSVGIAIAHFKSPLQDVVRAAQAAEKRAKRSPDDGGFGRGAVALSIFKRSGEILEWGTRWSQHDPNGHPTSDETVGYRLFHTVADALLTGQLNTRFPHKLETLLAPYASQSISDLPGFESEFPEILCRELDHCLNHNEGGEMDTADRQLFLDYWQELEGLGFSSRLTRLINLLRAATWSVRGSEKPSSPAEHATA
jgi:CRISPR-associated protein Cmr2